MLTFKIALITFVVSQILFQKFLCYFLKYSFPRFFLVLDTDKWTERLIILSYLILFNTLNTPILFDQRIYFPRLEKLWWLLYDFSCDKPYGNRKLLSFHKSFLIWRS